MNTKWHKCRISVKGTSLCCQKSTLTRCSVQRISRYVSETNFQPRGPQRRRDEPLDVAGRRHGPEARHHAAPSEAHCSGSRRKGFQLVGNLDFTVVLFVLERASCSCIVLLQERNEAACQVLRANLPTGSDFIAPEVSTTTRLRCSCDTGASGLDNAVFPLGGQSRAEIFALGIFREAISFGSDCRSTWTASR